MYQRKDRNIQCIINRNNKKSAQSHYVIWSGYELFDLLQGRHLQSNDSTKFNITLNNRSDLYLQFCKISKFVYNIRL